MNFQNLQNNFKTVYNNTRTVPCFFAGTPLFLLGDITAGCGSSSLITALSSGTALAIDINTQKKIFSIQQTQENLAFTCRLNKLSSYNEKNYAKPLFHIISKLNTYFKLNLTAADLLFEHNTIDTFFHNCSASLISALFLLFEKNDNPVDILSVLSEEFSDYELRAILSTLVLKKGNCVMINDDNLLYKQYTLPISFSKIVIIKTDIKKQYMTVKMKNAYNSLKKYLEANNLPVNINGELTYDDMPLTENEVRLLRFMNNEEKRIGKYPAITGFDEFCGIINSSCKELLEISANSPLLILAETISATKCVSAFRPLADNSSVYCIVNDRQVDEFITVCEREYEKKAGYKPTFYICDTVSSGIEHGIIH